MVHDRKLGWVEPSDTDQPNRKELLQLYQVFQTRQIADLDMVHRYANYYVVALLVMVTAFVLSLSRAHSASVAGLLVTLPVVSFMLSQQGKLMVFRFYRRYNEGRVRLTKIEYLLRLHSPVKWSESVEHEYALWPEDQAFVLGRYINEARRESASCKFIQRRSWVPRCWQLSPSDEGKPFRIIDAMIGTACNLRNLLRTSRVTNGSQSPLTSQPGSPKVATVQATSYRQPSRFSVPFP